MEIEVQTVEKRDKNLNIVKNILLIPIFLFTLTALSQETKNKPSAFSLGISFSPEYSNRVLKAKEDEYESLIAMIDSSEVPKFGFTTGIHTYYDVLKRLTVESGILFSDKGYKMTSSNFVAADPNDPLLLNLKSITEIIKIYYLEIPVKVNYQIVSGKLSVLIVGGVSANIFLDNKVKYTLRYNDGSEDTHDSNSGANMNSLTVSLLAGIGLDYKLTGKLCFSFEPIYKRDITTVYSSEIAKHYFYSFGANIGLRYRI
jgi:hypothetical protein